MSFETFWKAYPRKTAKGAARKAFGKALRIATAEEIMEGLERFIRAEPWTGDIRFCPHPATWLNREQWADEYEDEPTELPLTDRQKLVAFIANNQWKESWGERPTREEAKARLDALGNGHYERMRLVR